MNFAWNMLLLLVVIIRQLKDGLMHMQVEEKTYTATTTTSGSHQEQTVVTQETKTQSRILPAPEGFDAVNGPGQVRIFSVL